MGLRPNPQLIKLYGWRQIHLNLSISIFSSVQLDIKIALPGNSVSFNQKHLAQSQAHDKQLINGSQMVTISILRSVPILCNCIHTHYFEILLFTSLFFNLDSSHQLILLTGSMMMQNKISGVKSQICNLLELWQIT